MRCDRLASVIFRAAGSIFASRSARLAREIPRPTAKASEPRKTRSARPAALPARRSWNLERPRHCLQNRPTQTPHRFRFLPLSQPLTRFTAPRIHPLETLTPYRTKNTPARLHHRPPSRHDRPDLHDHLTTDSPIVLSFSSQPLTPCTFTPSAAPSKPQNAPELHYA